MLPLHLGEFTLCLSFSPKPDAYLKASGFFGWRLNSFPVWFKLSHFHSCMKGVSMSADLSGIKIMNSLGSRGVEVKNEMSCCVGKNIKWENTCDLVKCSFCPC